jgi:hypothetical protein
LNRIERELHEEMAKVKQRTLGQIILEHMEEAYKNDKTYKFSSKMIIEYCETYRPGLTKPYIMSELSNLKKAKKLISLDEKVPDQPGAVYFALSSVLEEVTNPANGNSEMPPATPANFPAHDPFDKVNTRLSELSTAVLSLPNMETALEVFEIRLNKAICDAIQSVNGTDDYKRGIKDGIKLAVEMGIRLPDSE